MNQLTSQGAGGALYFAGSLNEAATVTIQGKAATVLADNTFSGKGTVRWRAYLVSDGINNQGWVCAHVWTAENPTIWVTEFPAPCFKRMRSTRDGLFLGGHKTHHWHRSNSFRLCSAAHDRQVLSARIAPAGE
jgi:hypothetical protein